MGFFEDLGRKVGEFTHEVKESAAEEAPYACEDCGERFFTERSACPECGSERLTEREIPSDAGESGSEAGDADGTDGAEETDGAGDPSDSGVGGSDSE